MTNVTLMTAFILMPIRQLVSKSLDTARMAMPTFVYLMSRVSSTTSTMVRTGVMIVTIFVVAPQMVTWFESRGIVGYTCGSPPVK